jgi:hypothetical protein
MRSPLLLSILMAATSACDQSLTHEMTGTGGTGTGQIGTGAGGGAGARTSLDAGGLGGSGGKRVGHICNTLAAEYQSALTEAETCQVGASDQCYLLVSLALVDCPCPTFVTDGSALMTIQNAWLAAGCRGSATPTCAICPGALNTTCVSVDGGSVGACSYLPGTGGTSGTGGVTGGTTGDGGFGGDGGFMEVAISCRMLESEYAAVLSGAETCTAGAAGQCGQQVLSSLSPCSVDAGCMEFVTDSSILNAIQQKWGAAGCANHNGTCPLVACAPATSAACVPSDAGGSFCSTSFQSVTTSSP